MTPTKRCSLCGEQRPRADFHRHARSSDGRQSRCKECARAQAILWRKENVERNRLSEIKRKYGITAEEYQRLLDSGVCAICGTDSPGGRWNKLHCDHDHLTGRVRGALCDNCNQGLGKFRDNPDLLGAAADYLREHAALVA